MLRIDNACISFGEETLFSGFSLHIPRGEIVCIAGESGRGKTSLLKSILGFLPLTEGTITVGGIPANRQTIDSIRQQIAWIPQEVSFPTEWVQDMIQLPFNLKNNRQSSFTKEELFACFAELGLETELCNKRVAEISGGQKQRIMLAVSVMLNKPLLIVDEPTSALDADSSGKVLAFLRKRVEQGLTILAVSHDKEFARGCDKSLFL